MRFYERSLLPVVTLDHNTMQIIDLNQATLDLVGLDASDVLGRPGGDFLDEPSPDMMLRVRALRGDSTVVVRRVKTAYGERVVELNMAQSGRPGVSFVQLVDITDLVEAAAVAEERAEVLAAKADALETVAERLAHDLRAPMTAISGFAQLLVSRDSVLDHDERTEMLERISSNTIALADMTSALVGEASSEPTTEKDSYDVDDLLSATRALTEVQLSDAGGEIRATTNVERLPVPISAVRQAVLNLVSNSITYRHPDRPLLIDVTVHVETEHIVISVRDNGVGLPTDPAPLFEAGTRGDNGGDSAGAGLGLAFTKAAMESLGGGVTAHPRPGGAEFRLAIPASVDPESAPAQRVVGGAPSTGLTAPGLIGIIDASPIATVVIDLAVRQILRSNRACKDMFGTDGTDGVGRAGADFLEDPVIGDALRAGVIADPTTCQTSRATIRTPSGPRPVIIWLAGVQGTPLAVAQIVDAGEMADAGDLVPPADA